MKRSKNDGRKAFKARHYHLYDDLPYRMEFKMSEEQRNALNRLTVHFGRSYATLLREAVEMLITKYKRRVI